MRVVRLVGLVRLTSLAGLAGRALRGDALQALLGLDDLAANGCAIGGFHRFGVAGERLLDFREVFFGRAGGFVVEQAHAGFEERCVAVGTRELAAAFFVVVGPSGMTRPMLAAGLPISFFDAEGETDMRAGPSGRVIFLRNRFIS